MLRVYEERALGVGVRVDEAGRYGQSRRVDDATCLGVRQVAYRLDPLADYTHVGAEAGGAGAVYDLPPDDKQVKHLSTSIRVRGRDQL